MKVKEREKAIQRDYADKTADADERMAIATNKLTEANVAINSLKSKIVSQSVECHCAVLWYEIW